MDPMRGLNAWHLDMRNARRRGFRMGMIAGFFVAAFVLIFALGYYQ